ncbi:hypothetical protein [Sphingobacterium mizutaii]|uniref:hypothetical protein n=1 Tax=Sphingobacterium mizutaii TaxID=1010 RepID=UPI001F21C241|nr:hypothetical protein [Sphingobacterium mizutaii]
MVQEKQVVYRKIAHTVCFGPGGERSDLFGQVNRIGIDHTDTANGPVTDLQLTVSAAEIVQCDVRLFKLYGEHPVYETVYFRFGKVCGVKCGTGKQVKNFGHVLPESGQYFFVIRIERPFFDLSGNGEVGPDLGIFPALKMFLVFLLQKFGCGFGPVFPLDEYILFLDDMPLAEYLDDVQQDLLECGIGVGISAVL